MLTIQSPLKLQSLSEMVRPDGGFGEKLTANYSLMATQISAKDLLHLLTAPPELFLLEGGAVTDIRHSTQNRFEVAVDVVNNVINRLLQQHSTQFTYQDEVYITSVLHKLGVPNPSEFMEQVRLQREEYASLERLYHLHRENREVLREAAARDQKKKPSRKRKKKQKESEKTADALPYTLHNEIYSRLGTGSIYNIVHSHQSGSVVSSMTVSPTELRTAEQQWVSRTLSLREMQSSVFAREPASLRHIVNRYEAGELFPEGAGERQVYVQAAAAALLGAVSSSMVTRVSRALSEQNVWLDLRSAVSQSVENTLARFEMHHREASARLNDERDYSRHVTALYNAETDLLQQFVHDQRRYDSAPESHYDPDRAAQPAGDVPLVHGDAPQPEPVKEEGTQERVESLREQLERIDARNREIHTRIERSRESTLRETKVVPDRSRTLQDALRSVERPEEVLRELAEGQAVLEHPSLPAQVETALEAADPQTRRILETVLRHQRDPGAALDDAVVQVSSAGAFNEEVHRIARQESAEMLHREEHTAETESLRRDVTEQVLRQMQDAGRAGPSPGGVEAIAPVATVHRRQETAVTEEIEEILERHTRQQVRETVTKNTETVERADHTQVQGLNREVADRTAQDIGEIVNQTLARQMNVISEKVYSQMERRLQNERARRGR